VTDPGHERHQVHVSPAHERVLAGELVHEGDLVDAGGPLARPNPEVPA
jgi:hypothetical protein